MSNPFQALEAAFHGAGQIASIYQKSDAPRVEFEATKFANQMKLNLNTFQQEVQKMPHGEIPGAWAKYQEEMQGMVGKQPQEIQYALRNWWDSTKVNTQMSVDNLVQSKWRSEELFGLQRDIDTTIEQMPEDAEGLVRARIESAHATGLIDTETAFKMSQSAIGQMRYSAAKQGALQIAQEYGWNDANMFALTGDIGLSSSDREKLQGELGRFQKLELGQKRDGWFDIYDQLRSVDLNGQLTEDLLIQVEKNDPRAARFDGDPGDVISYFRSKLAGGVSDTDEAQTEAWDRKIMEWWADPTMSDDEFRRKLLSSDAPTDTIRRWDTRKRNPSRKITTGIDHIERVTNSITTEALKGGKGENILDALSRSHKALDLFYDGLSTANRSNMTPQEWDTFVEEMASNVATWVIDDSMTEALENLIIRPDSVSYGSQRKGLWGTSDVNKLQTAIQSGRVSGFHEMLRPQLNQLALGYEKAAEKQIGTRPMTYISPSGQPFMQYIVPQGAMGSYGAAILDNDGNPTDEDYVSLTYMTEGNQLKLKTWDAGLRQWVDATDQFKAIAQTAGIWNTEEEVNTPPAEEAFREAANEWAQRNPGLYTPPEQDQVVPQTGTVEDQVKEAIRLQNLPTSNRRADAAARGQALLKIANQYGISVQDVRKLYEELYP